ncbi:MAG: T9SS type A sorting domain-containing protein [Rhodothermales bacterium]|nr:T9SS type A sorting domain-containing protein [Rhodothermales bacterium]
MTRQPKFQRPLFLVTLAFLLTDPAIGQPVTQPFTFNVYQHQMPAVRNASVAWGDIDNDGDLDAFISGRSDAGLTSAVFRNEDDGSGQAGFQPLATTFDALAYSRAAWADYDGDGDLDLAVAGSRTAAVPYQPAVLIYRNDGGGFTAVDTDLPGLHSGALAWGDADNDGDLDLLLTGVDVDGAYRSILASNAGGAFSAAPAGFPGFAFGEAKWGDFDADGDADLLISGATDEGFRTSVYRNNGTAVDEIAAELVPLAFSSVDWGDYDGDGDLDIVVSGGQVTPRIFEGEARIYRNDGGSFSALSEVVQGTLAGTITWGDYDNDGDLDLLSLGAESALGRRTARIYRNVDGTFEHATYLIGAIFASADWGDFDGDGDLDLLSAGATSLGENMLNVYTNERQVRPDLPAAPDALRAEITGSGVWLEWTDGALGPVTYDLRIGTAPGLSDVRAAPADPASGLRRLARPGLHATNATYLQHLAPGRYYWSVQTVGPNLQASAFAEEASFEIAATSTDLTDAELPTTFGMSAPYPNPFSGTAWIEYDLPKVSNVQIRVYDMLGRLTASVWEGAQIAGTHRVAWQSPRHVSGGLYLVELRAGEFRAVQSLTLIR